MLWVVLSIEKAFKTVFIYAQRPSQYFTVKCFCPENLNHHRIKILLVFHEISNVGMRQSWVSKKFSHTRKEINHFDGRPVLRLKHVERIVWWEVTRVIGKGLLKFQLTVWSVFNENIMVVSNRLFCTERWNDEDFMACICQCFHHRMSDDPMGFTSLRVFVLATN